MTQDIGKQLVCFLCAALPLDLVERDLSGIESVMRCYGMSGGGLEGFISRSYSQLKEDCRSGWEGAAHTQFIMTETHMHQPMRSQALELCLYIFHYVGS